MSGRFIHAEWTFHPEQKDDEGAMNAVTYGEKAQELARKLQVRETRKGFDVTDARKNIADEVGCAPGTIETLVRGRRKSIGGWLVDRLRAALLSEIRRELKALIHEYEVLQHLGEDADPTAKRKMEECIREAQEILSEEEGTPPLA